MKKGYCLIVLLFMALFNDAFAGSTFFRKTNILRQFKQLLAQSLKTTPKKLLLKWCAQEQGVCETILGNWQPYQLTNRKFTIVHALDYWRLQDDSDSWLTIGAMPFISTSLVSEDHPYAFGLIGLKLEIDSSQLVATGAIDIDSRTSQSIAKMPPNLQIKYFKSLLEQTGIYSPDQILKMMEDPYYRYMRSGSEHYNEICFAGLPSALNGKMFVTGGFCNPYHIKRDDLTLEAFEKSLEKFGLPLHDLRDPDFFEPVPSHAPFMQLSFEGPEITLPKK